MRAGLPTTVAPRLSTSLVTTAPAPTIAPSPMVMPPRMMALPPIQTSLPMVTGRAISMPVLRSAKLLVMLGAIDLHAGAEHAAITDRHPAGIKNGAASIEIDALAESDIDAVGAVKRRLDEDIECCLRKECPQGWRNRAARIRRQRIMRVDGQARLLKRKRSSSSSRQQYHSPAAIFSRSLAAIASPLTPRPATAFRPLPVRSG